MQVGTAKVAGIGTSTSPIPAEAEIQDPLASIACWPGCSPKEGLLSDTR